MGRFTIKIDKSKEPTSANKYIICGFLTDPIKVCNAIDKLGQLEDIEEELGIDLSILFNALKNGCYVKSKANGIEFAQKVSFTKNQIVCKVYANGYFRQRSYKNKWLKDYGKTWALTKEELV